MKELELGVLIAGFLRMCHVSGLCVVQHVMVLKSCAMQKLNASINQWDREHIWWQFCKGRNKWMKKTWKKSRHTHKFLDWKAVVDDSHLAHFGNHVGNAAIWGLWRPHGCGLVVQCHMSSQTCAMVGR
jgi:hypothetical protein